MPDGAGTDQLKALREQAARATARNMQNIGKELRGAFQSFKRGGRVHRTGIYKLHRGERVIPARQRRGGRR